MSTKSLKAFATATLLITGVASSALASAPVIGMASAQTGITLDNSKVSGNATLFDGSTVQATGYSRLKLSNGTRMDLNAGAKAKIYANRASLETGMTEIQSGSGFELDTDTVKIRTSQASAIARVRVGHDGVFVTALNGPVDVLNREGLLVARVAPGLPLSFLPQAGSMSTFDSTGCVVQKSGAAVIVDANGNQVYELRGADLRKAVGNTVHVTGTIDSSATAAGGATQVIKVSKATIMSKGGCTSVATKIGASTAAAGLGAAAGAGAAVAGGVAVGTAAGVAVGVSTTALVVGGVAAAAAVGVGAAAASGSFSSSSP